MGTIKVPYLVTRPRKKKPDVRLWVPPARDVKAGYLPKTRTIDPDVSDADAASLCEEWTNELHEWRAALRQGLPVPTKCRYPHGSVGWILHDREVGLYHSDDHFLSKKPKTREGYLGNGKLLKRWARDHKGRHGYLQVSGITLKAARTWHKSLMKPAKPDGPQQVSRAKAAITFLRKVLNYAVEEGVIDANPLAQQRFKNPKPRKHRPTYRQILKLVAASRRLGRPSIGLATMAQFDLIQRQGDIIGVWEKKRWKDGLVWGEVTLNNRPFVQLAQNKSGGDVEVRIPLADYPILHRLLVEAHDKIGTDPHPASAIIMSEGTGVAYKRRDFAKWFRRCADAAGWPKTLWNMDSRAGGVTEATDGGASEISIQSHSGHETIESISRYNRGSTRQAANVARIRRRVREQESND